MAKLASAFLDTLSQHRVIPNKVLVRNRQVAHALEPLAEMLGIKVIMRRRLPAAQAALASMRNMLIPG
jgi:hypothetical protein